MSYAYGFSAGEAAAFKDRRDHITRSMPAVDSEYARGFVDGYTPRDLSWALRGTAPAQAWWQEREWA